MRDLEKERELFERSGLATDSDDGSEALAATESGHCPKRPILETTIRPQGSWEKGDPVEVLLRLSQAVSADAAQLTKRIDPVAGWPERTWSKSRLQVARRVAADMVERLIAFLDHCAGDPDHEPALAVPTSMHPSDQAMEWASALYANTAEEDEREKDLDTEEGDELDEKGEPDLSTTECINQEHIGKNYSWVTDGEMNLATTENIDQRFASFSGSRTDGEADDFPYDPPRDVETDYLPRATEVRQRVDMELRQRGLRERNDLGNIVELAAWRR
jgi:hypothetical protein